VCQWGLVASCDLIDTGAERTCRVGLKERNAALVYKTPLRALVCRNVRAMEDIFRLDTSEYRNRSDAQVVNCNFRFLDRLFGSGLSPEKRRALMNYNAGRQSEMNIPIPLQSIRDESLAIVARKMGCRSSLESEAAPPRTTTPSPSSLKTCAILVVSRERSKLSKKLMPTKHAESCAGSRTKRQGVPPAL